MGQEVKGKKMVSPNHEKMSEADVRRAIIKAVAKKDLDKQDSTNVDLPTEFKNEFGVSKVRITIREGRVRTAYPIKSNTGDDPGTWKWIRDANEWQRVLEDDS